MGGAGLENRRGVVSFCFDLGLQGRWGGGGGMWVWPDPAEQTPILGNDCRGQT